MFYFAEMSLTELTPILTILAGMLLGFYGLLKFVLKQSEKTAEADRGERQNLAKAVENMATSMENVAKSNKRIADESEKRNGHLAEISIQNKDAILDAIGGVIIQQQTVHNQTVEHEKVIVKE